jgi:hypothetical protein
MKVCKCAIFLINSSNYCGLVHIRVPIKKDAIIPRTDQIIAFKALSYATRERIFMPQN